jgi:4-amino-4-deoxy-L-arabinose transferase-like glycosyltransferase
MIAKHEKENNKKKLWLLLLLSVLLIVVCVSIFWIYKHPFAINWDESEYINVLHLDIYSFKNKGIQGYIEAIFNHDRHRPPGYRLAAFPLALSIGVSPIFLRLISILLWVASIILVSLTANSISGSMAGAIAAVFMVLCPIIASSINIFGTEYILYLSIAGTLYYLFKDWSLPQPRQINWICMGLFIGLGLLSKLSFIMVIFAPLLLAIVLSWRRVIRSIHSSIFKAIGLGIGVVSPWWVMNYKYALEHARGSSQFVRHSLGDGFLEVASRWITNFLTAEYIIGLPLVICGIGILSILLFKIALKQSLENSIAQNVALYICLVGVFPLMVAQLLSSNQNMRLISPSLIPLAVVLGIIAHRIGLDKYKWSIAAIGIVCGVQLATIIIPAQNNLSEQWDWEKLRQAAIAHQLRNPVIVHLGNGSAFNPPQIIYPWVRANEPIKQEKWLWRYEEGEIDWNKVEDIIKSGDAIITAPEYIGDKSDKQDLDNKHNLELVQRLEKNPDFLSPISLMMGRDNNVKILVFFRKLNN